MKREKPKCHKCGSELGVMFYDGQERGRMLFCPKCETQVATKKKKIPIDLDFYKANVEKK